MDDEQLNNNFVEESGAARILSKKTNHLFFEEKNPTKYWQPRLYTNFGGNSEKYEGIVSIKQKKGYFAMPKHKSLSMQHYTGFKRIIYKTMEN